MRLSFVAQSSFGEAKICYAYVSSKVKEYIFWFEITVNDSLLVKVGERLHHLSGVDFGAIVTEPLLFTKVSEQLSTV
jgi:hypothetical protein